MLDKKQIEKAFVHQHDMTDCGAACLISLIRYYGGDSSILHLREISGTSNTGTTLLGLYQAAQAMGFDAQGAEANGIPDLIEHGKPCILAVVIDRVLQHFVVCYGVKGGKFVISDPAKGVIEMSEEELNAIWTRKCLLLEPNASFEKREHQGAQEKLAAFSCTRRLRDTWGEHRRRPCDCRAGDGDGSILPKAGG